MYVHVKAECRPYGGYSGPKAINQVQPDCSELCKIKECPPAENM